MVLLGGEAGVGKTSLLTFVGRRVAASRAVVVVTYRETRSGRATRCGRSWATWPRRLLAHTVQTT